jgi:hypothetical protein
VRFSSAVRTRFSRLIFDSAPSGRSCDAVQRDRIVLATFQRSSARRKCPRGELAGLAAKLVLFFVRFRGDPGYNAHAAGW